ncbi:hypothetical protein D1AOALGA4SA_10941 [Olavius algarvensis Delta 1 endosymbiont]|nr:hypothetical protein D1AOALGA4SA_10941 [Olavius algarvensis Delta 1 endosymbiont]
MSVFRCQDLAPQFPDTRNLTPETFGNLQHLVRKRDLRA